MPIQLDYSFHLTVTDIFNMARRKYILYADRYSDWTEETSIHQDPPSTNEPPTSPVPPQLSVTYEFLHHLAVTKPNDGQDLSSRPIRARTINSDENNSERCKKKNKINKIE